MLDYHEDNFAIVFAAMGVREAGGKFLEAVGGSFPAWAPAQPILVGDTSPVSSEAPGVQAHLKAETTA